MKIEQGKTYRCLIDIGGQYGCKKGEDVIPLFIFERPDDGVCGVQCENEKSFFLKTFEMCFDLVTEDYDIPF